MLDGYSYPRVGHCEFMCIFGWRNVALFCQLPTVHPSVPDYVWAWWVYCVLQCICSNAEIISPCDCYNLDLGCFFLFLALGLGSKITFGRGVWEYKKTSFSLTGVESSLEKETCSSSSSLLSSLLLQSLVLLLHRVLKLMILFSVSRRRRYLLAIWYITKVYVCLFDLK